MKSVAVVNLGCPKNQIDAETMLGLLADAGYIITAELEQAEVIIVNTCGFIEQAKQESINKILEVAKFKSEGRCQQLIVSGCLSQRYQSKLPGLLPEVDAYVGTGSIEQIQEVIMSNISSLQSPSQYSGKAEANRLLSTWPHGYLKIAEGCNNRCSYCVIPRLRGRLRSKDFTQITREATKLVEAGIKEIIIIAQDSSAYGTDFSGRSQLPLVLNALEQIPGEFWVRVLYCYPDHINKELMEFMAGAKKTCRYLDIPLQHSHPSILASMGRSRLNADIEQLVTDLRTEVPGIALRTTFIVGYPGETGEHFQHLLDFVDRIEFEHVGAFIYSRERGTRAARMPGQVAEEEKKRRYDLLMQVQQKNVLKKNTDLTGSVQRVLIESSDINRCIAIGRNYMQAPEIDNNIIIDGCTLKSGTFTDIKVSGYSGYDLRGVIK